MSSPVLAKPSQLHLRSPGIRFSVEYRSLVPKRLGITALKNF